MKITEGGTMRLIEQMGGYDKAKASAKRINNLEASEKYPEDGIFLEYLLANNSHNTESVLLEYRRANNIFEVGDKFIIPKPNKLHLFRGSYMDIYTVDALVEDWGMVFIRFSSEKNHHSFPSVAFRHATDAEIKAGHRLDCKKKHL